jgi:hypothetical protein
MSGLLLLFELTWRNFLHNQFAQLCCVGVIFFLVQDFWFFYCQLKVKRVSPFVGKFAQCFTSQSREKKKHPASYMWELHLLYIFADPKSGKFCDHTTFGWRCCGWLAVVGKSSMGRCNCVRKESKGEEKFNKEWRTSFESVVLLLVIIHVVSWSFWGCQLLSNGTGNWIIGIKCVRC